MAFNLDKKIAQRKKQAEDRQISFKARQIARHLGTYGESKGNNSESRRSYFEDAEFKITCSFEASWDSDGGGGCSSDTIVLYKDKTVFREGHEIEVYVPGAWEKTLESLHAKAIKKLHATEKQDKKESHLKAQREKAAKAKKARSDWGL
jgi:hypothetical protein